MTRGSIRIFAVLPALLAVLAILPIAAQASYADEGGTPIYTLSDEGSEIGLVDIGNIWTQLDSVNEVPFTAEVNPDVEGLSDLIAIADEEWIATDGTSTMSKAGGSGVPVVGKTYSYTVTIAAQGDGVFNPDEGFTFVYGGTKYAWDDIEVAFSEDNKTAYVTGFIPSQTIAKINISTATVSAIANQKCTGKAITPSPSVTMIVNGTSVKLAKGTDYTLGYSNNVKVGKATVKVTGTGVYTGSVSKTFKIVAPDLSVKALWASKHSDGKVLFKWSKKDGVTAKGWKVKYRVRKIGGGGAWSGWTTKSFGAKTMQTEIKVKHDWVIEIHAQAKGDKSWSSGIITTPAGGKYQAMKYVHVKNASTNKRLSETKSGGTKQVSITLFVGDTVKVKPDYEYPVKNYTQRPKLYPTQMLYDVGDKSIISISKPDGSAYSGGMIDGTATIKGVKAGTTNLVFRAPNGRTLAAKVTVKPIKEYTFNGSLIGVDEKGNSVQLRDVISTNTRKRIVLKGTIQFAERYRVGSNTIIDASMGKTGVGAGATIYSATNGDGCLTNSITSGNYDSVKNITIKGGTWKKKSGYHAKTMMLFTHASNISIENIYEECDYNGGHCVELVACKDVTVTNCNLQMKGTNPANNEDEPMQLDHANRVTSPTIPTAYQNNHACKNVKVIGCTLQGGRGLCSGHCGNDTANNAQSVYHYNVVVKNCTITGQSSEALALYNVVGCEVSGNTIKSKSSATGSWRSDGMCVRIPKGSTAPKDMASSTITIKNNTVYGGRSGIIVNSLSASDFGKVVITGNTVRYKGDAKNAITVSKWYNNKSTAGCKSKTVSGNKTIKGW